MPANLEPARKIFFAYRQAGYGYNASLVAVSCKLGDAAARALDASFIV